jgi:hypothetical protein
MKRSFAMAGYLCAHRVRLTAMVLRARRVSLARLA